MAQIASLTRHLPLVILMVLYTATNSVSGSSAQTASLVNAAQMQVTPEMSKQDLLYVKDISGNYAIYKLSRNMLVWAPDFADSMALIRAMVADTVPSGNLMTKFSAENAIAGIESDISTKQPYSDTNSKDATRYWVGQQGFATLNDLTQYETISHATATYLPSANFTWSNLSGKPTLFSGSYTDLSNKPVLFSGAYADLTGKPTLFSGNYNDLTNKPTIPTQNVYNAGNGIGKSGTEPTATFYVDSTKFMSIASANTEIATMQGSINGRVPQSRTLTINGTTQDLSANRTWNVGDLLSSGSYANPTWITSLAWSKITSAPAFLTAEVDGSITNEIQTLTYNAGTLSISGGNSVNLPVPTTFTRGTGTVVAGAVTINASRGQITYASNIIAAGTANITFTNNTILSTSNIQLTINSLGNTMGVMPALYVKSQAAGSCVIAVSNLNLLSLLNTTFGIDFTVQN